MSIADSLASRTPVSAAHGAFCVLNGMQESENPADQILGLAMTYLFMCRQLGIHHTTAFYIIENMERVCHYREENTLETVKTYIEEELRKKLVK